MCDQDRAFITESASTLSSKNVLKVKKFIESLEKKERKVPAKNVVFITACNILVQQIEQKIVPIHLDYNHFVELSCVINNKSNSESIEETENVFHILTKYENASQAICSISKFLKGKLLIRYVNTFSMKKAMHTFSLKRAQIFRYMSFYNLVFKYQWLIYLDLDFTKITDNIKQKKKILEMEEYNVIKQRCSVLDIYIYLDPHLVKKCFDNTSD